MSINNSCNGISNKKIALFSIYLASSIILQAVEYMFLPQVPIPGVKVGMANIIVLLMLGSFTLPEIGLSVVLRVIISSLATGTMMTPSFYLSLGGAVLSFLVIAIFYKTLYGRLSLVGMAMVGAVAHNIGQLVVAYFLIDNISIIAYGPVLMLAALPFGILTGVIARITLNKLEGLDVGIKNVESRGVGT